MKQNIIQAVKRLWELIKFYLWDKPVSKPPKQEPIRTMATDVSKDYMIVTYHGQRINMLKDAYPLWKMSSRADKRVTMLKFQKYEKEGTLKFIEIEGHTVCVKNLDYERRVQKAREI